MPQRCVGAGHHPRLLHECGYVALALVEGGDVRLALLEDRNRGLDRVDTLRLGNGFQGLADHASGARGDQQRCRTTATAQILGDLRTHPRHRRGVVKPLEQRRAPTVLCPARDQRSRQRCVRRGPWILVGVDDLTRALRRLDHRDDRRGLSMHIDAKCLDMGDMDRNARLPPDRQRLRDRAFQTNGVGRFIAGVGVIDATLRRRRPCQRDNFASPGKALRRVEQPGRQPKRALTHRIRDKVGHLRQFGGGRHSIGFTDHLAAHPAQPDISRVVDPNPFCSGTPKGAGNVGAAKTVHTDEGRRHALHQEWQHQPCGWVTRRQCFIAMGVGVDEPRRDDQAARIDHRLRAARSLGADIADAITTDRDIATKWCRVAGIDGAAPDQHIRYRFLCGAAHCGQSSHHHHHDADQDGFELRR